MAARRGVGADRVLAKLRTSVENGEYYEAHQMYRTLYFRYCGLNKWEELKSLLLDGARLLLSKGQTESGADLASLYVDVLIKSETSCTEQTVSDVASLFAAIDPSSADRPTFLTRALEWSKLEHGGAKAGHPALHKALGMVLWKEGDLPAAKYHLMYADDGASCARLLVQLHTQRGTPDELDLFITQAVLQYLALKSCLSARAVFSTYLQLHPQVQATQPPYSLPLLNFLHFLLETVTSGESSHFKTLCDLYKPSLNRDPAFSKLLQRVGVIYFNLQPAQRQQGVLGNLIQSLMSGFEGLDDSDSEGDGASGTSTKSPVPKVAKMDTGELD